MHEFSLLNSLMNKIETIDTFLKMGMTYSKVIKNRNNVPLVQNQKHLNIFIIINLCP